jgi:hypothetical protein
MNYTAAGLSHSTLVRVSATRCDPTSAGPRVSSDVASNCRRALARAGALKPTDLPTTTSRGWVVNRSHRRKTSNRTQRTRTTYSPGWATTTVRETGSRAMTRPGKEMTWPRVHHTAMKGPIVPCPPHRLQISATRPRRHPGPLHDWPPQIITVRWRGRHRRRRCRPSQFAGICPHRRLPSKKTGLRPSGDAVVSMVP